LKIGVAGSIALCVVDCARRISRVPADAQQRESVWRLADAMLDADGRHHGLRNLFVFDGSMVPTSLGANPQLSICGIVARNAVRVARRLS
jgi:hypothetical protein